MSNARFPNGEPVARTDEEKARYPDARAAAERLAHQAKRRAESRPAAEGPAEGNTSRRTLHQMFAFNESLHDDEAGRWIAGAYSLSAQEGLRTPSGNDPIDEYESAHFDMYGGKGRLVTLRHADVLADRSDAGRPAAKPGRPADGIRGNNLSRVLAAIFKPSELAAIPTAVAKRRHRNEEQCELLRVVGAFVLAFGANVAAVADAVGISRKTLYGIIKEAKLYERRLAKLEARLDRLERSHSTLEASTHDRLARLVHGPMLLEKVQESDPRSLDERFSELVAALGR